MFNFSFIEIIGYLATLIVVFAFSMKDLTKLRVLSSLGNALFVLYGILHASVPVIVTNAVITAINLYYLMPAKRLKPNT